ncbi:MAG TPA: pyrimidine-nucleoside phosphorylase [Bacillota bacterium]|nr:pyrimidine-nucleoside phosphorylase [Bacillota bacterium]
MNAVEMIMKKRRGETLTRQELEYLIDGYCKGDIPDYQMAAWSMAVCFQGMTSEEAKDLTEVMAASGEKADLSGIPGPKVDKHSTGGVGDKTSLVVAPLVASAGVPVCKMSGRGVGHTGGTIVKLESIPGLRTSLTREGLIEQVKTIGLGIAGQTQGMVPADKKLYALRDVTGTVESLPLIAASIMSKKLAGGADSIVLDVKVGNGAFLKTQDEARDLARLMVRIGNAAGRRTVALLTRMDQPLGQTVGNALEVREAIETLLGQGPDDLLKLSLALGSHMLYLAGLRPSVEEAEALLRKQLESGAALKSFRKMIQAQGGNTKVIEDLNLLPQAPIRQEVLSNRKGYVSEMATEAIGRVAMNLGAGRVVKESIIDPAVGIVIRKKTGDFVHVGESLATIYAASETTAEEAVNSYRSCVEISEQPPVNIPLILEVVCE